MTVEVLNPHGFCAGVTGAIQKARSLVQEKASGETIYCLHELVHNELVVADLAARGMVFVESLEEVPEGATVLFSAHGVSPVVRSQAAARALRVVDATCPFVARVHRAAHDFATRLKAVVVVGKAHHAEVKGILGEVESVGGRGAVVASVAEADALASSFAEAGRLGVVSQTTMNADEVRAIVASLARRFEIETTAEVCRATKERQDAVRAFAGDALLVLGSVRSSNTQRLAEVARTQAYRVGSIEDLNALDLSSVKHLGLTSGASTPESFLNEVLAHLQS